MRITFILAAVLVSLCVGPQSRVRADDSPFAAHPAADQLDHVFKSQAAISDFKPSGMTRRDYLTLMASDIDYWVKQQNSAGAIIDPVEKKERQYSTPAFAWAAGLLINEAGRKDLLEPATRAMTWATSTLANHKAADGHGDFFIPMVVHARRLLKDGVSAKQLAAWDKDIRSIVPEQTYNMGLKGMNWNLVSSSGELLRRKDDLVAPDNRDAQLAYLNDRLADHLGKFFTQYGMYADPGVPMTYDEFARMWLDDMMAHDAYNGELAAKLRNFLKNGGLSTILLLSPSGEWPGGGRSSHHNWTEAETIAICEIHATQWNKAGRADVAGAFKRAAHLGYQSMQRWVRPTGELYIIKNRFGPDKRFAYERYSNHSQYNTLPMAMLAIGYEFADDSIAERPAPAEVGGYVFDLRDKFHKVVAAAGGYYVEIDTAGDPRYNATGLQRIHRTGVLFPPFSDTTVEHRGYGPKDGPGATMAPGIQWKNSADAKWQSLGDAFIAEENKPVDQQVGAVRDVDLKIERATPEQARLTLTWKLVGTNNADQSVSEQYTLSIAGVQCVSSIPSAPATARVLMPVLVEDGVDKSIVTTIGRTATILHRGSLMTWSVASGASDVHLDSLRAPAHNGIMQALTAAVPNGTTSVTWTATLEQQR